MGLFDDEEEPGEETEVVETTEKSEEEKPVEKKKEKSSWERLQEKWDKISEDRDIKFKQDQEEQKEQFKSNQEERIANLNKETARLNSLNRIFETPEDIEHKKLKRLQLDFD
ncbi:unnamed protein product [marine sediment metagenome]|uniref:Uncharacterized protein n=1 Tax=marine sediment metagenome TaxID=412755 RepID=X1JXZ2_9ZZZZ